MKYENEITVEIDCSLEALTKILEKNGFKLKEVYDLNDIYMIHILNKKEDENILCLLNKCVLIRDIIEQDKQTKMLTYKYKEYNEKEEIIKQGKVKCIVDSIESSKELFEKLDFEELLRINDHMLVYANSEDELVVQNVNGKHIYIEIEDKCYYINKFYNSTDEMKKVIKKYSIPIKNDDYFVKKAQVELKEKYGGK